MDTIPDKSITSTETAPPSPAQSFHNFAEPRVFQYKGKEYGIDEDDFLVDYTDWDKDFAEGMAPRVGITGGLTNAHWNVIEFIRRYVTNFSECPKVHKTCMALKLHIADLAALFPAGYRRGACKLAGLCYHPEDINTSGNIDHGSVISSSRMVYRVNVRGFLVDPSEWNEDFAIHKWNETKMPCPLGKLHWQIIMFLRAQYERTGEVPTVYETCRENNIDIEELGMLFPDGYHRGAVKIAGLSG